MLVIQDVVVTAMILRSLASDKRPARTAGRPWTRKEGR